MSEWISVESHLPKPFETIILLHNGRESISGFMTPNGSFYQPVMIDFESERLELNPIGPGRISAWLPLPNPPEEK